jgi:hypothetical protein
MYYLKERMLIQNASSHYLFNFFNKGIAIKDDASGNLPFTFTYTIEQSSRLPKKPVPAFFG